MVNQVMRLGLGVLGTTFLLLAFPLAAQAQPKPKPVKPVKPSAFKIGPAPRTQIHQKQHPHHLHIVFVRQRHWHHRDFASRRAAHTYFHWLGYSHLDRRIRYVGGGVWRVAYRSHHKHQVGSFYSLAAARDLAAAYRARGFSAWIYTRHF